MVRFTRIALILPILLLVGALSAHAQRSNDGSLYSRYGLGTIQSSLSSRANAMGNTGTALVSPNYISLSNPASWGSQVLTRFIGGFKYHSVRAVDAENRSSRLNASSIQGVSFSFPLLTRKLGFAAAYQPITRIGYRIEQPGTLTGDTASTAYTSIFSGDGGLQMIRGGLGYRISQGLFVGGSVDMILGMLENDRRTLFESSEFVDTHTSQSTRLHGVTATFGGLVLIPTLLSEDDGLSLGISARLPTRLQGTRVTTVGESLDRDTVGTAMTGTVNLPMRLQVGLSYQASDYLSFAVDGLFAPWEQFKSDFRFNGYAPAAGQTYNNRWQIGAGMEYRPAGGNVNASYLDRIVYRLGGYVEQSYIKPNPQVDLMQYALTAGVSLPTARLGNRIDLNLEIGTRGTTNYGLVRDTYYTLSIVVNFGERWFRKRLIG